MSKEQPTYKHESDRIVEKMKKQDHRDQKKAQIFSKFALDPVSPSPKQPSTHIFNTSHVKSKELFEIVDDDENPLHTEPENLTRSPVTPIAQQPSQPTPSLHIKPAPVIIPTKMHSSHSSPCPHGNYETEEEEEQYFQKQMYQQPNDPSHRRGIMSKTSKRQATAPTSSQILSSTPNKPATPRSQPKNPQRQKQQNESFGSLFTNWLVDVFELDDKPVIQRMSRIRNDHCIGLLMMTFALLDVKKRGKIEKQRAYSHFVSLLYYTQQLKADTNQSFDSDLWEGKKEDFLDTLVHHKVNEFTSHDDEDSLDYVDCESWRFYIQEFDLDDVEFAQVLQKWIDNDAKR